MAKSQSGARLPVAVILPADVAGVTCGEAAMSPELIAIITAAVIILGFLWNLHRDLAGIHRDINGVHRDIGDLRERMARIEGLFEGFTRRESSPPTAA